MYCPECGCDSLRSQGMSCPDWQVGLPEEEQDQTEYFYCDSCGYSEEGEVDIRDVEYDEEKRDDNISEPDWDPCGDEDFEP